MLTDQERKEVENHIRSAERKTAGELVVRVAPASGGYAWVLWAWAVLGAGVASVAAGFASHWSWPLSALQILEWQCLGACVGFGLYSFPFFRRLLLSKKTMALKVHRAALAHFTDAGVANTRERTGILIYLSSFEHRVEILADSGIHKVAKDAYWKDQAQHIAQGIRNGKAASALCRAIDEMGALLADHFPRPSDDTNELPDTVQ